MLENVYLNDIPLDMFMEYFKNDTLKNLSPLQIPLKYVPYEYTIGSLANKSFYRFDKTVFNMTTGNIISDKKSLVSSELNVVPPFYDKFFLNSNPKSVFDSIRINGFPFGSDDIIANSNANPTQLKTIYTATIPDKIEFYKINANNTSDTVMLDINDSEFYSYYPLLTLVHDSAGVLIRSGDQFKNAEMIGSKQITYIYRRPFFIETLVLKKTNVWKLIDERTGNNFDLGIVVDHITGKNKEAITEAYLDRPEVLIEVYSATKLEFILKIYKNAVSSETKTNLKGQPLFLDSENNETVALQSDSMFLAHHNVFKGAITIVDAEEVLPLSVYPKTLSILTQNGEDNLVAYNQIEESITYQLLEKSSIPSGKLEINKDLPRYIFEMISNFNTYEIANQRIKYKNYFSFSSDDIISLKKVNGIFELENPDRTNEIGLNRAVFQEKISADAMATKQYIIRIDDSNRLAPDVYIPIGSDLKFTKKEINDYFGAEITAEYLDDLPSATYSHTEYRYDDQYHCYYSITRIIKEINQKPIQEFNEFGKYHHFRTGSGAIIEMPSELSGKIIRDTAYPTASTVLFSEYKNRYFKFSSHITTDSEILAPKGVFKRNRQETLRKMFTEMFNKISNETYTIENSFIDSDATMKMFIYSNGLYNLLKNDTGLDNIKINRSLIISPDQLKTSMIKTDISKIDSRDNRISEYVSKYLDSEKALISAQTSFERLINYKGFGSSLEQASNNTIDSAIIDNLSKNIDFQQISLTDQQKLNRDLTENKTDIMSFLPKIVNSISNYYGNSNPEFLANYLSYIDEKFSNGNILNEETYIVSEKEVFNSEYDLDYIENNIESILDEIDSGKVVIV